jgi:hypothetical protein
MNIWMQLSKKAKLVLDVGAAQGFIRLLWLLNYFVA